jgi:hypothetical protein
MLTNDASPAPCPVWKWHCREKACSQKYIEPQDGDVCTPVRLSTLIGRTTHTAVWQELGDSTDASPPRRAVWYVCSADAS